MPKTTYKVHTDIAFVKYWGKKDEVLRLPANGSISMKLESLFTTTTVEFSPDLAEDVIQIGGQANTEEAARVTKHLDRIRALAADQNVPAAGYKAKVVSKNSFPKATGLSSSGSGFGALSMAGAKAIGLDLSQKELSILARQGSGSACRTVCGGFVEWHDGDSSETSFAETIFPAEQLDIRDIVAIADPERKLMSTTQAHTTAESSLLFQPRQERIKAKLNRTKQLLADQNFSELGRLIEAETLEFHSVMLTSQPAVIALRPGTVQVMHLVHKLRAEGVECYFSINTGHNVHVLTLPQFEDQVAEAIQELPLIQTVIQSTVAGEPEERTSHLF